MKSKYYILAIIFLLSFILWINSEPKIITYEPMEKNIAIDSSIVIKYSAQIDPNSIIKNLSITPNTSIDWSYNSNDKTIIIKPIGEWKYNTTYQVELKAGVRGNYTKKTSKDFAWEFTTKERDSVAISLLGDFVLFHLEEELAKGNKAYAYQGLNKEILNTNNFVITNLENPISSNGTEIKNKAYRFKSSPNTIEILEQGNIDAVTLANNHALDYGPEALSDTVEICNEANITTVGYGENGSKSVSPVIVDYDGFKIGIVSYLDKVIVPYIHRNLWQGADGNAGIRFIDNSITEDIKYLKKNSDIVIVALHWGIEREKSITNSQIKLAHKLIDNGADIIMGHHPHVVQGVEKYKDGLVLYSLGNFVFPPTNEYRRSTYVAVVNATKKGITNTTLYPIKPVDGVPYSMNELEASKFNKELSKLSTQFSTELVLQTNKIDVK